MFKRLTFFKRRTKSKSPVKQKSFSMLKLWRILLTFIGGIVVVDCLVLIMLGNVSFGTVVPFLIGIIFIAHGLCWRSIQRLIRHKHWLNRLWRGLWLGFVIWLFSFGVFVMALKQQIKHSKEVLPHIAAIIVLGSGTTNGKPSPTLAKRLDTAAPLIKRYPQAMVITSGGVGFAKERSEADVMATYLHDTYAIEISHITQESSSTSTHENLANSQELLLKSSIALDAPIVIVTSDFHSIRAKAIAQRQGYSHPILIASKTPLSIRYNAWFREYFAFISGWLLNEY